MPNFIGFRKYVFVLSMEMRKVFSYRVNFWVNVASSSLISILIAYCLWKSVFETTGVSQLRGYSFSALMAYFVLVPFLERIIRGTDMGFMSEEIYSGAFTRFQLYPVNFFGYKFSSYIGSSLVATLQLALAAALLFQLFPPQLETTSPLLSAALALSFAYLGAINYFFLTAIAELVSFWIDNAWALSVMLRFSLRLLGGTFLPVSFYPEGLQNVLMWTPFPYMVSFPIECFFGRVSSELILQAFVVSLIWSGILCLIVRLEFRRGTLRYTGVGI